MGSASSSQPVESVAPVSPSPEGGTGERRTIRWRRLVPPALCLCVYTVLAAFAYGLHPPATSASLPLCGCGDVASQVWFLAWPAFALTHGLNPLYSSWVDYPHGVNLMNNTAEPFLGLLFAPVVARYGAVAVFNLLMRLAFAVSGISMCLVLRRWTRWWPAAFVGGLFYELSPFMVGQSQAHLFLTFVPLPPIMVALFDELVIRRRHVVRNGILLGTVIAVQLMISGEILAMSLLAAGCALLVLAIRHPVAARQEIKKVAAGVAAGVASFVVLAGYPAWVYFAGPYHVSGPPHPLSLLEKYRSLPGSLVYPTTLQHFGFGSWLAKGMSLVSGNGAGHEHTIYLGVPLLCVLAFILVRCRRVGQVQLFAALTAGAWLVTLGLRRGPLGLPYELVTRLPIVNGGLDLRYSFLMYLGASVVLAVGLDRMQREGVVGGVVEQRPSPGIDGAGQGTPAGLDDASAWRRRLLLRTGGCIGIATVGLVPLVPALPYASSPVAVPALFTASSSPVRSGSIVLSYPLPISWGGDNDQALLWQSAARMRFKLIAFRGAVAGPDHQPIREAELLIPPDEAERLLVWGLYGKPTPPPAGTATTSDIRRFLQAYDVGAVTVVPTGPRTFAVMAYFQTALGVQPTAFEGSYVWPNVQQDLAQGVASGTRSPVRQTGR